MKNNILLKTLRSLLFLGALYLLADSIFHFSGFRLLSFKKLDSNIQEILSFFSILWGSATLLISLLIFQIQQNLKKNSQTLILISRYGLFHAFILIYFATRQYENIIPYKSFYIWNNYYSEQLILESIILIFLFYITHLAKKRGYLK